MYNVRLMEPECAVQVEYVEPKEGAEQKNQNEHEGIGGSGEWFYGRREGRHAVSLRGGLVVGFADERCL